MKILKEVLRKNRAALVLFAAATALNAAVFFLYDILTEPLLYAAVLSFLLLTALLAVDFVREKRRADERSRALTSVVAEWRALPEPHSLAEEDCRKMIAALGAEVKSVTLVCGRETLVSRWENDRACEWRTEEWLEVSLKSLERFAAMENTMDTDGLTPDRITERILAED